MMDDWPVDYAVGICQRTGFKVKASNLGREWTGLVVRQSSIDPRHPLLDYPAPRGEQVRDNATGPESENDSGDTSGAPTLEELVANS